MSYLINLSESEIVDILKNGSTNQKQFIEDILQANNNPEDVILNIIAFDEEIGSQTQLRDWLNGGVMTFEEITPEIQDNYCCIPCKNGFGVVYY